jgi:hypothetical protein
MQTSIGNVGIERILLSGFAIIASVITAHAEMHETKAEAIARWGTPGREAGNTAYWQVDNRYVKEIFDDTGHSVMCWYFSDSPIDEKSGQAMTVSVFPKETGWKEEAVPANADWKDAKDSRLFYSDSGNTMCIGSLTQGKDGSSLPPIYFIYYSTPRGQVMMDRGQVHFND